jgi:formate/nitrite transporter FocA (FNT family)
MSNQEELAVETRRLTAPEIFNAAGSVSFVGYFHWLLFATLGNVVGGVVIVSLLSYGHVRGE